MNEFTGIVFDISPCKKFELTRDNGDVRLPRMAYFGLSPQSALRSVKHSGTASGKTMLSNVLTTAGVTRHIPVSWRPNVITLVTALKNKLNSMYCHTKRSDSESKGHEVWEPA